MKRMLATGLAVTLLAVSFGEAYAATQHHYVRHRHATRAVHHTTTHPMHHRYHHRATASWGAGAPYTRALNLLGAQGYTQVGNLSGYSNAIVATVTKGGQTMTVTINPMTGAIQPG